MEIMNIVIFIVKSSQEKCILYVNVYPISTFCAKRTVHLLVYTIQLGDHLRYCYQMNNENGIKHHRQE